MTGSQHVEADDPAEVPRARRAGRGCGASGASRPGASGSSSSRWSWPRRSSPASGRRSTRSRSRSRTAGRCRAWPHLLGTDGSGRDILSLLMAGSRTTVIVAVGAGIIATVIGVALAALGALTARWVRESVAVFVDILIAFPVLIIAMMISAVWGGSLSVVIWSVGIGFGVNIARVTRPELRTRAAQRLRAGRSRVGALAAAEPVASPAAERRPRLHRAAVVGHGRGGPRRGRPVAISASAHP